MNLRPALTLASFSALLTGCIMFPIGTTSTPAVAPHLQQDADGDTRVLVLQIVKANRIRIAQLDHEERRPLVELPLIVPARDLVDLNTNRIRWAFCIGGGYTGSCGIALSDQVIEVCFIWPDGRVLSLGEPVKTQWTRETRGHMPEAWRAQLLVDLPQTPVLHGYDGICPAQMADLKWPVAERQWVIDYLERLQAKPGLDGGFVISQPPAPRR